jgi:hypothetical protein
MLALHKNALIHGLCKNRNDSSIISTVFVRRGSRNSKIPAFGHEAALDFSFLNGSTLPPLSDEI